MDLVERYIAAVKFWLPAASRDDIAAELAEDIRCEIEEIEQQKERKLTEDEIADLLKARGAPMVVASRYMPQRSLIGPEIMPVYLLVLKIVAAICLLPLVIAWIAAPYFGSENVPSHLLTTPANSLLTAFAVVTIIFAIIEREGIIPAKTRNWNPKKLPPVKARGRIKRADSIGDIVSCLVLLWLFLAGYMSHPDIWGPSSHVTLSPVWVPYWQVMLTLVVLETPLAAANLFHPVWTVPKILLRMLIDLGKAAATYWLLQSGVMRSVEIGQLPAHDAARFVFFSQQFAVYAGVIAGAMAAIIIVMALVRLLGVARRPALAP